MATHPRLNQLLRLIDRAPSGFEPEPASTPRAPINPLTPPLEILHELDHHAELTTQQIVARMGLLPTAELCARIDAGLAEMGYHRVLRLTPNARVGVHLWTATAPVPDQPTLQMRRIHEAGDRAHGLLPLARRPGSIARLFALLRGAR